LIRDGVVEKYRIFIVSSFRVISFWALNHGFHIPSRLGGIIRIRFGLLWSEAAGECKYGYSCSLGGRYVRPYVSTKTNLPKKRHPGLDSGFPTYDIHLMGFCGRVRRSFIAFARPRPLKGSQRADITGDGFDPLFLMVFVWEV